MRDFHGEILRRARIDILHLSQEEAAERLNVGRTTVQRWERGESRPQPEHWRKIEEIYGPAFRKLSGELDTPPSSVQENPLQSVPVLNTTVPIPLLLSEASPPDEPQLFIISHMTTHFWDIAFLPDLTSTDKQRRIRQAIKEFDCMNINNTNSQVNRREALCALATLPLMTLRLKEPESTVPPNRYKDMLGQSAASLEACWTLYKSGNVSDVSLALECVSRYLRVLKTIINDTSPYRKNALALAARYARVQTSLRWHCIGATAAIQSAKDAVVLSKGTEDIPLQLEAYSTLAWAYLYAKKYPLALATAQETEEVLRGYSRLSKAEPLHPSVWGRVYSNLALMQAKNGKSPDVAVGKASEIDPKIESYGFMDFKWSNFLVEAGMAYCYSGNQGKAMEWLEKRIDPQTLSPLITQSAMGRVETINTMALSSLKTVDRDLEKTTHLWVAGIEGAKAIKSEQHFSEAATIYELMEVAWPGGARIKDLRDLIVHW